MGNVIPFPVQHRRWLTFCQDCDPSCRRPFDVPAHRDPRTGDFLTPCPVCRSAALAEVPQARLRNRSRS